MCVCASTLCEYDLKKGGLFLLSWARMCRVCMGSVSSAGFIGGGGGSI